MKLICTKCHTEKEEEYFHKNKCSKTGRQSSCKICRAIHAQNTKTNIAEYKKKHYQINKEDISIKGKQYRKNNLEIVRAQDRESYYRNREVKLKRISEYQKRKPEVNHKAAKRYRQKFPEKQTIKAAKRRANKMQATPKWITNEWEQFFISEIYHLSSLRTKLTKVKWNVDHKVPLKSNVVCGLHCAANLGLLVGTVNSSKSNRYWEDMP